MRADKLDVDDANPVGDSDDQTVVIAFNVEPDPVVLDKAGATITGFNILWAFPDGLAGLIDPCFQRLLDIGVFFPE